MSGTNLGYYHLRLPWRNKLEASQRTGSSTNEHLPILDISNIPNSLSTKLPTSGIIRMLQAFVCQHVHKGICCENCLEGQTAKAILTMHAFKWARQCSKAKTGSLKSNMLSNRCEVLNALRSEQGMKLVDLMTWQRSPSQERNKDSTTHNQVLVKKVAPREREAAP